MEPNKFGSIVLRSSDQYAMIERYKVHGWSIVEGVCMLETDTDQIVYIDLNGNVKKIS